MGPRSSSVRTGMLSDPAIISRASATLIFSSGGGQLGRRDLRPCLVLSSDGAKQTSGIPRRRRLFSSQGETLIPQQRTCQRPRLGSDSLGALVACERAEAAGRGNRSDTVYVVIGEDSKNIIPITPSGDGRRGLNVIRRQNHSSHIDACRISCPTIRRLQPGAVDGEWIHWPARCPVPLALILPRTTSRLRFSTAHNVLSNTPRASGSIRG